MDNLEIIRLYELDQPVSEPEFELYGKIIPADKSNWILTLTPNKSFSQGDYLISSHNMLCSLRPSKYNGTLSKAIYEVGEKVYIDARHTLPESSYRIKNVNELQYGVFLQAVEHFTQLREARRAQVAEISKPLLTQLNPFKKALEDLQASYSAKEAEIQSRIAEKIKPLGSEPSLESVLSNRELWQP